MFKRSNLKISQSFENAYNGKISIFKNHKETICTCHSLARRLTNFYFMFFL